MDRRTLITAAGAVVPTMVAASSAMVVNLGLLDASRSDGVGELVIEPPTSTGPVAMTPAAADTGRSEAPAGTAPAPERSATSTSGPDRRTIVAPATTAAPANPAQDDDRDDDRAGVREDQRRDRRPGRDDDD